MHWVFQIFQKLIIAYWKWELYKKLKHYLENDIKKECEDIKCNQVKWEYTKYKIKQWFIKKPKEIASNRRKTENNLTEKIFELEKVLSTQPNEQNYVNL